MGQEAAKKKLKLSTKKTQTQTLGILVLILDRKKKSLSFSLSFFLSFFSISLLSSSLYLVGSINTHTHTLQYRAIRDVASTVAKE